MSGPVGGNVGAHALSRITGRPNLICIDMGGTSFEVSLIVGGEAAAATEKTIAGLTVLAPMVDVHSIGAGGGSIAWNDDGGLRVGPQSAGAAPGPACYGAGGVEPTVTDANLALGRLRADKPFAGRIHLRPDLATAAIDGLGREFGLSTTAMAEGILQVINARMANAIRTMTVQRGIDPRDFALVAFGGAGPMHAPFIGAELGIRQTIVPNFAGAFSAWGMLKTTVKHDLVQTHAVALARTRWPDLEAGFRPLEAELTARLDADGMAGGSFERSLDLRYVGQEYYLTIALAGLDVADPEFAAMLKARFDDAYEAAYGHKNVAEQVEVVNLRIRATAPLYDGARNDRPDRFVSAPSTGRGDARPVIFDGSPHPTRFIARADIGSGARLSGPLIVEEQSCTSVAPPGYRVSRDAWGNLIIEREGD
jgi:N-methylhydantoinase A